MAKGDGRGGARPGAGRKKKILTAGGSPAFLAQRQSGGAASAAAVTVPVYFKDAQAVGVRLEAARVQKELYNYLAGLNVAQAVPPELINHFALTAARWIQCERMISAKGFLAAHPTTGADCVSPYVSIAQGYQRQLNTIWLQLAAIIKEQAGSGFASAEDNIMAALFNGD